MVEITQGGESLIWNKMYFENFHERCLLYQESELSYPKPKIVSAKAQNWILYPFIMCCHVLPCAATCHVTLVDMCLNVFDHFCVIMMVFK